MRDFVTYFLEKILSQGDKILFLKFKQDLIVFEYIG